MHSNIGREPISPTRWSLENREAKRAEREFYGRRTPKRNRGRKVKTLRAHRQGR